MHKNVVLLLLIALSGFQAHASTVFCSLNYPLLLSEEYLIEIPNPGY